MAVCSQWNAFFFYFTLSEHTHNVYMCNLSRTASCCLHRFRSVEGLLWCAEPRFELGPALQQCDALLFVPRRTHHVLFIIIYGLQNQPAKAAAELTAAREANQFTCSPTNCDEVIQSFIRYQAKRFYDIVEFT